MSEQDQVDRAKFVCDNAVSLLAERDATIERQRAELARLNHRCGALTDERDRLRDRQSSHQDQLVWLADWCRRVLGVENNSVIGRDGWPYRLVEVVAKAVNDRLAEHEQQIVETFHDYRAILRLCGYDPEVMPPTHPGVVGAVRLVADERDRYRREIEAAGNNPAGFDWSVLERLDRLESVEAERDKLAALLEARREHWRVTELELEETKADRDRLQRFKDWCHGYLDARGVPHHPPGTHGAEGCRIGDRMDWLMARLSDAESEAVRLKTEKEEVVNTALRIVTGNRCERHTGENTPPLPEFMARTLGVCLLCTLDERDRLRSALLGLQYRDEPGRFCDHAADPCSRCEAAREAVKEKTR